MIRKRPELDLENPHGQIVNPIPEAMLYKPVHGGYPGDTEEMFTPEYFPRHNGCCHKTVYVRCKTCVYRKE